ncbi:MAG: insulinase family protein [Elusimicrobia bacterium]|nr:insulinase family protein [Elusimicrobiota bacterium]
MSHIKIFVWGFVLGALFFAPFAKAVLPDLPPIPELKFKPTRPEKIILENGMTVYLLENHDLPLFHLTAMIRTGSLHDPSDKIGLTSLFSAVQRTGGTRNYPPEKLDQELEYRAISLGTFMESEKGGVSLTTISQHIDKAFELFSEVLRFPVFDKTKLEIERNKALESIRRRNDEPKEIARRESYRLLYGPGHPYGWRPEISTLRNISRKDLLQFHQSFYHPNNTVLVAAGDIRKEKLLAMIEHTLGDWPKKEPDIPPVTPIKPESKRTVYLFPKQTGQAWIRLIQFGPKRHDPDKYNLDVLNEILGGGFASRLFSRIRSRLGLAYAIGSRFTEPTDFGGFFVACGTKNESAAKAVQEILKNLEEFRRQPVSPTELSYGRDSIINSFVFNFTTPFQIAQQQATLEYYGYPSDYLETYVDRIKAVGKEAVLRSARKWLKPESMLIVVVGDPKKFDQPLTVFGPLQEMPLD